MSNFEQNRSWSAFPIESVKTTVANAVLLAAKDLYRVDNIPLENLTKSMAQPKIADFGDLAVPVFLLAQQAKKKPNEVAGEIANALTLDLGKYGLDGIIAKINVEAIYMNMTYAIEFLAKIVPAINEKNYLARMNPAQGECEKREKVMIEYSQPNTHKAFHVGHMRNAALGDALVRLHEHIGHDVIAANYFGDEGAHVAKCLWLLENHLKSTGKTLHELDIGTKPRGEYLGMFYSRATELLELDAMTKYPFPGVYSANVLEIASHPQNAAWKVVTVQTNSSPDSHKKVVCGGTSYNVGDVVAYVPVGGTFQRKNVVVADKQGVESHGIILAYDELGVEPPADLSSSETKNEEKNSEDGDGKAAKGKKKSNNTASAAPKKKEKEKSKIIFVLPAGSPIGVELPEIGRLDNPDVPADQTVMECYNKRKKEVGEMLHDLESREASRAALWDETKEWSLTEFKNIYRWLDCRFDHDFFESQVGDASKKLVMEFFEKGVLVKSQGAIGADLTAFKLPFCILVKSDGTGLYATKDLALAHRKFTEFQVEKSVYVVDAAQTLHFQQVFKTLELMGYRNASKCFHLPYGQVRVPEGKMSSRKGTVIYFSDLQRTLGKQIYDDFLVKLESEWSKEELETAQHALSVATIKYGMLNVDPSKDIVFEMSKWAAKSGDTGVYLMYAYARTQSIIEKVELPSDGKWNPSLLVENQFERLLLLKMQIFWDTILNAAYTYKPSAVCSYLYEISKLFMSWYDVAPVKSCENPDLKYSRLKFVSAIGELLRVGLSVLGIRSIKRM